MSSCVQSQSDPKQGVQAAEFIHKKQPHIWMIYNQVHEPNETEEKSLFTLPNLIRNAASLEIACSFSSIHFTPLLDEQGTSIPEMMSFRFFKPRYLSAVLPVVRLQRETSRCGRRSSNK
jgi:hypothetical protein